VGSDATHTGHTNQASGLSTLTVFRPAPNVAPMRTGRVRQLSLIAFLCLSGGLPIASRAGSATYSETEKRHSWFSLIRPARKTSAEQFVYAQSLRERGSLDKAARHFKALALTWPSAPEAPAAQLANAEILEKRGKYIKAFDEYQFLFTRYAGRFPYEEVLGRQLRIAKEMLGARKGKFLLFGGFQAPERAAPMLEKVVTNGPQWEHAPEAQYLVGKSYELSDQWELAVVAYMNAQHRYPDSPFSAKAAFGRAHCLYRMALESPNDEDLMEQAWAAVVLFLNTHPTHENAAEATKCRDDLLKRREAAAFQKARFYERVARKPESALMAYREFVKQFPKSEWAGVAQERIGSLSAPVEKKP